jgi:hypothetical protein
MKRVLLVIIILALLLSSCGSINTANDEVEKTNQASVNKLENNGETRDNTEEGNDSLQTNSPEGEAKQTEDGVLTDDKAQPIQDAGSEPAEAEQISQVEDANNDNGVIPDQETNPDTPDDDAERSTPDQEPGSNKSDDMQAGSNGTKTNQSEGDASEKADEKPASVADDEVADNDNGVYKSVEKGLMYADNCVFSMDLPMDMYLDAEGARYYNICALLLPLNEEQFETYIYVALHKKPDDSSVDTSLEGFLNIDYQYMIEKYGDVSYTVVEKLTTHTGEKAMIYEYSKLPNDAKQLISIIDFPGYIGMIMMTSPDPAKYEFYRPYLAEMTKSIEYIGNMFIIE